jgi:hypothetical protein
MKWGRKIIEPTRFRERPNVYDIVERLKCDVSGPLIHIDYYRQDIADALAEILRLRRLVYAFNTASLAAQNGDEVKP